MAAKRLSMPREIADVKLGDLIREGQELLIRHVGNRTQLENTLADFRNWHDYCSEFLNNLANVPLSHEITIHHSISAGSQRGLDVLDRELRTDVSTTIQGLESIKRRLKLFEEPGQNTAQSPPAGDEVFIVHGHDDGMRETVARFIESKIGVKVVILHEKPGKGRTIAEKLEQESVAFAVVLLSPDDVGCKKGEEPDHLNPRARQNVMLELGYFWGKFGRERVCCLKRGEIELPTDYVGPEWISYDDGGWRLELAQELKAAGFKVDLNKIFN